AQEGNVLAAQQAAVAPAEHIAMHIEGDEDELDGAEEDIDIEIDDPEADAIVNDALNLDEAAESEAAAEVLNDSVAEEAADLEKAAAEEVDPYDGPDPAGEDADAEEEDPYEAFRR